MRSAAAEYAIIIDQVLIKETSHAELGIKLKMDVLCCVVLMMYSQAIYQEKPVNIAGETHLASRIRISHRAWIGIHWNVEKAASTRKFMTPNTATAHKKDRVHLPGLKTRHSRPTTASLGTAMERSVGHVERTNQKWQSIRCWMVRVSMCRPYPLLTAIPTIVQPVVRSVFRERKSEREDS